MSPGFGKVEKMESHLRRRFQIPVSIVVGARPEPRFYNVRLTYRIGERTADRRPGDAAISEGDYSDANEGSLTEARFFRNHNLVLAGDCNGRQVRE